MWDLIRPDGTRLLLYPWLRLTRPDLQPPVPAADYDENRQAWKDILRAARQQDEARKPSGPVVDTRTDEVLTTHLPEEAEQV